MSQSSRAWRLLVGGVLLGAVAAGCGHPAERKLQGRWVGDGVEAFDDRDVAAVTGWVKGMSLEFSGSDLTVSIPTEEPRTGTFRATRMNKEEVTVEVKRRDGTLDRVAFRLDDENSMRWMVGGGRAVFLRRED